MKYRVLFMSSCNCGFPTTRIIEAKDDKQAYRKAKKIKRDAGADWYIAGFDPVDESTQKEGE